MFELKLTISTETTLKELREFVKRAEGITDDMPVASYDMHCELDGIAVEFMAGD